jgi:hypothetical protein
MGGGNGWLLVDTNENGKISKSGRSLCITATDCFNRPGPASAKTGLPWLTMNVLRRIRYDGNPQIIFVYDVPLYAAKRLLPTAPISRQT